MTDKTEAPVVGEALLPCPFCGGEAFVCEPHNDNPPYAMCRACYAAGKPESDADRAITAWNRRAPLHPVEEKGASADADLATQLRTILSHGWAKGDERVIQRAADRLAALTRAEAAQTEERGAEVVALLASYCDDNAPSCSDASPCLDCLRMANVFQGGRYIGELGRIAALSPPSRRSPMTDRTDTVVVPRDQLTTLCQSLARKSLLPGEGEALINCWIKAHDADQAAPSPGEAPSPRPVETAPRDGTTLRLLVRYSEDEPPGHWTPLEDAFESWTIGHNSFDNTGEDEWQFVGWDWSQDHYLEAPSGTVIGWLPFHGEGQ